MSIKNKLSLIFSGLIILIPTLAFSDSNLTAFFNDIRVFPEQKAGEIIASREISFNLSEELLKVSPALVPLVGVINNFNGGKIILESGIDGINISIDKQLKNDRHVVFVVSLIRGKGNINEGGRIDSHKAVALLSNNNEVLGKIFVGANIYIPGCEVTSGYIRLGLDTISLNDIRSHSVAAPFASGSAKSGIDVICNAGNVNELLLKFTTLKNQGAVIIPDDEHGVGFLLRNGLNNNWIRFGPDDAETLTVDESGRLRIPLEAYYARYSDVIKAGSFSGKVLYSISYK